MRNNSTWFESPFPKASAFYNPQPLRPQHDNDQEDSHWNKPIYFSPQPIAPAFRVTQGLNQLSPWSKIITQHEDKFDHIAISGLVPDPHEHGAIEQKLIYSGDEDDDPVTPIKHDEHCKQQVEEGQLHTTGRKSQLQPAAKRSRPREKGLRKLSQRAFQIVQEMRNATYKEVAAKLVQELNEEQFQGENKEEQNIKRRVYDALNVLIALGVLKKEGRRIVSERNNRRGRKSDAAECEQVEVLRGRVEARVLAVEEKKRKLKEAEDKLKSITTLLRRNKESGYSSEIMVPFPFIGIFVCSKSIEKIRRSDEKQFVIRSLQPMQPFGDIDSLKWLKQSLETLCLTYEDKKKIQKQEDVFS